jgi:protein-L-isoaspartate(D-aspartate) O-methyltransferase
MVERQIVARGVRDARVLDAMRDVPRHSFVPETLRADAYEDRPLAIGEAQTISQPYMVAIMTELLAPAAHHRVLEIGTGSGYQTAVLSRLAGTVVSIERLPRLAAQARATLDALGITNVRIHEGDGTEGWPGDAPYDRILVTAGAPAVPDPLRQQLAEGGRLVIPIGPPGFQHVTIIERHGEGFDTAGPTPSPEDDPLARNDPLPAGIRGAGFAARDLPEEAGSDVRLEPDATRAARHLRSG